MLLTKLYLDRGCIKSLLPPAAAKFYIETALDSLILRSKINESRAVSIYYLAQSAMKRLLKHFLEQDFTAYKTWQNQALLFNSRSIAKKRL